MRWQEEVTLIGYEMQWTVRYFLFMSRKWVIPPTGGSAGAIAYGRRKQAVWEEQMKKADHIFRTSNPAYQSPF
jgi:hypothetical protein